MESDSRLSKIREMKNSYFRLFLSPDSNFTPRWLLTGGFPASNMSFRRIIASSDNTDGTCLGSVAVASGVHRASSLFRTITSSVSSSDSGSSAVSATNKTGNGVDARGTEFEGGFSTTAGLAWFSRDEDALLTMTLSRATVAAAAAAGVSESVSAGLATLTRFARRSVDSGLAERRKAVVEVWSIFWVEYPAIINKSTQHP